MENAQKKLTHLIQLNTLRDLEIKFREAQDEGMIIPEIVYEIMRNLETSYMPDELPPEVINEITERD